jgi:hypothetical protein
MKWLVLCFAVVTHSLLGQPSLTLEKNIVFKLSGDLFEMDSLVMRDSSVLILDNKHLTTTIRADHIFVGKGCIIYGAGENGWNMYSRIDPNNCGNGFSATNFIINFSKLEISDFIELQLFGGNGGQGVKWGQGACDGGNGGNVTLSYPSELDGLVREKIVIKNWGGAAGLGQVDVGYQRKGVAGAPGLTRYITIKK